MLSKENRFMANKINNKEFAFKCLKALETHGKVEEIQKICWE